MTDRWINLARNHTRWVIGITVGSLTGLLLIQAYLMSVKVRLEQRRFNDALQKVLIDVHHAIEEDSLLSDQLIRIFEHYESGEQVNASLTGSVRQQVKSIIDSALIPHNLRAAPYSFAFYHTGRQALVLSSVSATGPAEDFTRYSERAGWRVRKTLGQGIYRIGLSFYNHYWYLFRQVALLLVLSLLLMGLLVGSFLSTLLSLKRQKQLVQMKNDFINNLTHELKTPIFASSLIHKVVRKQLERGQREQLPHHLTLLEEENDRLKVRVERVLAIAQLEQKRLLTEKTEVDLHSIIRQSLRIHEVLVAARQGTLSYQLEANHTAVMGDAVHLENMVSNLLDNALKYSPHAPHITITTCNKEEQLVLCIADQGEGIPPEEQKHIFEKFYRVSSEKPTTVKGFGLGLNYVHKIVALHGGHIRVESQSNRGSTFIIKLPTVHQPAIDRVLS